MIDYPVCVYVDDWGLLVSEGFGDEIVGVLVFVNFPHGVHDAVFLERLFCEGAFGAVCLTVEDYLGAQ